MELFEFSCEALREDVAKRLRLIICVAFLSQGLPTLVLIHEEGWAIPKISLLINVECEYLLSLMYLQCTP